ncbi:MAG: hypothetical protein ACTSO7_13925 [Candidatus Heimdallarchaeota archaeon]
MGQESQKVIGLLLISVMICAGFANTVNVSKFTENIFKITGKAKEILDIAKGIQETDLKETSIHPTSERLLSNDDLDLNARSYMAYRISEESKNDLAVIYLIGYEIAKIINGEIQAHHRGYLVTKNNELAVLIEHGIYLKYTSDATKVVNELSTQYENVILASCDSNKYSSQYSNVKGFVGRITVKDVIFTLNKYCNFELEKIADILEHSINEFVLAVTYPQHHNVFSPMAIVGCAEIVAFNWGLQINSLFLLYVTMEMGTDSWGGWHINRKCFENPVYNQVLTDKLIKEILNSPTSLYAILKDETEGMEMYKVLIFKYMPINGAYTSGGIGKQFGIADVLIGPNPNNLNAELTILTMHAHGKDCRNEWRLLKMMLQTTAAGYDFLKNVIRVPAPTNPTQQRLAAPFAIAELPNPIPSEFGDTDDEVVNDGVNFIWEAAIIGSILLLIAFNMLDDILIQRFGDRTLRYYTVWIAIVVALIAALVLVCILIYYMEVIIAAVAAVIGPGVLFIIELLTMTSTGNYAAFMRGELTIENSPQFNESNIDIYSAFYDDDNDGIPNEVEKSYYEEYIEEYIDGSGTTYEFEGPCDDGEIDWGVLSNPNTWMDPYTDYDGDGLITMTEVSLRINPFNLDTDNDGLFDNEELIIEGTIIEMTVQITDCDKDNQFDTQIIPVQIMTDMISNPRFFDTDGDGIGDEKELTYTHTEPLDPDTDHDGLIDGYEVYATIIGWDGEVIDNLNLIDPLNPPTDPNWIYTDSDNDGLMVINESMLFTNPNSDDTDGDLLTDLWEYENGFDPTDSSDGEFDHDEDTLTTGAEVTIHQTCWFLNDTDNDGWTDDYEIEWTLTNPTLLDSDFDQLNDTYEFNLWISLGVPTVDAYYYINDIDIDNDGLIDGLEFTYDCNPFVDDTDADGLLDGDEILIYFTNPLVDDHDNDGWEDGYEVLTTGTNPKKADTDTDGKNDKVEFLYWKSRGKSDGTAYAYCKNDDVDNDNLDDGYEINIGTDPLDSDSDNDGLSDGYEVSIGTNPKDNDCDNDGILDGLEVNNYHTDPEDSDSDNDGYDDLYEIINGTDPNDASDYPGAGGGGFGF